MKSRSISPGRGAARIADFSCSGKERFVTKARAIATIERRQRKAKRRHCGKNSDERRDLMRLSAYHCDFCHHWHIGGEHGPKGPR